MHVSEEESVQLASYRLKDLAYDWVVAWRKGRVEGVAPMTWQEFQDASLDKFFPLELREAKVEEFMNLRQGSTTVKEYCLKFNQLAKYAPNLITDNRASMEQIAKSPQFQSRSSMPAPSSASASALRGRQEQGNRSSMSGSQNTVSNRPNRPPCTRCGGDHGGKCLWGQKGCYGCGQEGHGFRDCPHTRQGNRDVRPQAQPASASAPVARPAPTHGASSSTGGGQRQNKFYALPSRQE
ncbi:uncharacterized protein LOC124891501 [Capsicum annuum]|uniref:uncharacterized protein LOC124891501 n=1 Tax=Capsicum annuum TaxID=4072 RepID=UPI001FB15465|nr:uncharacterized protein LOC124891501 [Capsicum annuum]